MIQKKLAEIQKLWLVFDRSALNPFTKSKYCPLPELRKKLWPILDQHDLLVYHTVSSDCVSTHVVDTSDDSNIVSEFPLTGTTAQLMGAAITYAKRYNLGAIFNIITDDDVDGNGAKKPLQVWKNIEELRATLKSMWISTSKQVDMYLSKLGYTTKRSNMTETEAQRINLSIAAKTAQNK